MRRRGTIASILLACLISAAVPLPVRGGEHDPLRGGTRYAGYIPDVPDPTCAGCGGTGGSHSSQCPYMPGGGGDDGGSGERRGGGDITNAPIFVAPAGIVGGIFMGGGWYFSEMAGKYRKVPFLKSYSKFMSIESDNPTFRKAFNFGSHIGGLPWLVLYLPTYPVRMAVVAVADYASRPSPPKPPDPRVAEREAIAKAYGSLAREAEGSLGRARGDREKAEIARERYLDDFVAGRKDLVDLRLAKGADAARAKAAKILDAWAASRREKGKIAAAVSREVREKEAAIRDAAAKLGVGDTFVDSRLDDVEEGLDALGDGRPLPAGVAGSVAREKKWLGRVKNAKTAAGVAADVKELSDSWAKAKAEGKDVLEWAEDPDVSESILRLNLSLLSNLKKAQPYGAAVAGGETAIDAAFAVSVKLAYAGQIEEGRALVEKLATARVFEDAAADRWAAVSRTVDAAREREAKVLSTRDRYAKLAKENQADADRYRRK